MKVEILDTTLRDGSYAVNFSFTSADVANICRELEQAGIDLIEIGHGVGLGGSEKGYGQAAETDLEYMRAASKVIKKSRWGMFCIPGIATIDDLDGAIDENMGFIRIGTNVDEVRTSKKFIQKAKKAKMFVAANFMKSYAMSAEDFAQNVLRSQEYGADVVYLVDSAGGMFPQDIRRYVEAIRRVTDIPLGFHGHDNLGMAVANSLAAFDMGVQYVDGSLQGLGRSSGNAATEILALAFCKLGQRLELDFLRLCSAGQKYVQPLVPVKGKATLDIVSGFADFHSSYMHHIRKYSAKYEVDPARLIIEYTRINKIDVDEKELEKVARKIKKEADVYLGRYDFSKYVGGEQDRKN